jgi:type IV secretory pathway VirB10-like protein
MDFLRKLFPKAKPVPTTPAPNAPNALGEKVKANPQVKRVSKAPIAIAFIAGSIIVAGVAMTAYSKAQSLGGAAKENEVKPKTQRADVPDWFEKQDQKEGVITSKPNQLANNSGAVNLIGSQQQGAANGELQSLNNPSYNNGQQPQLSPYQQARLQQWQQHEQDKQQLEQTRRQSLQAALGAETTIYSNNNSFGGGRGNANTLAGTVKQNAPDGVEQNPDGSAEKPDVANYLGNTRVAPVSPFEVKAGTIIPSVMIGGVNSDLPGQIIAQVSQSVYDTASGQYLLIPQGARLVGSYEHQVQSGQKRVFVIWNRIIYPDSSSVNLGGMPGADQAGYGGFTDKTNTHFFPTFRNALMLSAITAGVQLSQPRPGNGDTGYSSQQILASSLGLQMKPGRDEYH